MKDQKDDHNNLENNQDCFIGKTIFEVAKMKNSFISQAEAQKIYDENEHVLRTGETIFWINKNMK